MKTKRMNYEAWAIYNEGKRAFTNGLDDLDNPHRAGLKSHKLWSAGWHDASDAEEPDYDRSPEPCSWQDYERNWGRS